MNSKNKSSYLFKLDILIEDNHHQTALEQLIHKLNTCHFKDYQITSGIELGQEIKEQLQQATSKKPIQLQHDQQHTEISKDPMAELWKEGLQKIQSFKKQNALIRLIVNRGLGVKLNIPCRIINIDEEQLLITVYHVDEKQVYTFRLIEIEDFVA